MADKGNRNNNDTDKWNTQNKTDHTTEPLSTTAVSALPSREWVPAAPLPPTGTPHDGTWYGIPGSVWPGGVSPPSCVPSGILV